MGLGMKVTGYDVSTLDAKQLQQNWGIGQIADDLEKELCAADYVSLHIPAVEATKHFVNSRFLSNMKNTAFLINTSRGSVVDESALYESLVAEKIAGAGLDVFENEPYNPVEPDKDLRLLNNAVLTPHVGSSTLQACQRMAASCLNNIKAAYDKEFDQLDLLNEEVLAKY